MSRTWVDKHLVTTMKKHPLVGRKQTAEHVRKRMESLARGGKLLGKIPWNKGFVGRGTIDMVGQRFGRLLVVEFAGIYHSPSGKGRHARWLCQCDCGNLKVVDRGALVNGVTLSCKCLNNENAKTQGLKNSGKNNGQYGKISGPQNPNWRGGTSSERERVACSEEYKKWRKEVYKRDGYTCQVCGNHAGRNIQAHHILPFSAFPEYRQEPENGITLCVDCHHQAKMPITRYLAQDQAST